jgi:hypothetical protein
VLEIGECPSVPFTDDNSDERVRQPGEASGVNHSNHPPDSVLAAFLDGELTESERPRIEAHLEQCATCRRALADVVGVLEGMGDADAEPMHPPRIRPRRRRVPGLIVGAALAASIAGVAVMRQTREPADPIEGRTRNGAPTTRDERITELAAVTPLNGSSRVGEHPLFAWRSSGVDRYNFRLLAEDGVPIWSSQTSDTTMTLPASVRLEPGRSYFWRVDAMSAGIVASTRAQRFTVSP